jgi:hypothetical protein
MSRTVTQDAAARVVTAGNANFQVTPVALTKGSDKKCYLVVLPLTTMRDGLFGPFNNAIGGNGRSTRFGSELFDALRAIPGVEPSLDRRLRDGVTIVVGPDVTEEPPEGFWYQSHGLPASVCYAIQQQIMRHSTRTRFMLEYLRLM